MNLLAIFLLQSNFLIVFLKTFIHYTHGIHENYILLLFFTYSLLALFLILVSPSPKPQWLLPDSCNDPKLKDTMALRGYADMSVLRWITA